MTDHTIHKLAFDEIEDSLRDMLRPSVERLGYFGEMFQYLANSPRALKAFMVYSATLRPTLDDRLTELVALTVCTRLNFDYERIQHERLAIMLGLSRDWVAALTGVSPTDELPAMDIAARRLILAIVDNDIEAARIELSAFAARCGSDPAVALLLQTCRFITVCTIGRILDAKLTVPSIFDAGQAPGAEQSPS